MISVNTSKMDPLSQDNLAPLLKNTWEPVASTLFPEKPKKLPGNSLIIVVPSTPISSKRLMKWINLLSNMTTVITMPSNYGSKHIIENNYIYCFIMIKYGVLQ